MYKILDFSFCYVYYKSYSKWDLGIQITDPGSMYRWSEFDDNMPKENCDSLESTVQAITVFLKHTVQFKA